MEEFIECELLNDYQFEIEDKVKFFCPNCFGIFSEGTIVKHFGKCSFILKGRPVLKEGGMIISKISDDPLFRLFLNKFDKFLLNYTQELRPLRYSKNFDYWIFQYKDPNFGTLLIGLGYVRFNWDIDKYVLSALAIFPLNNLHRGLGTKFIEEINKAYASFGGIVLESPNEVSEHIADKLGIGYYSVL